MGSETSSKGSEIGEVAWNAELKQILIKTYRRSGEECQQSDSHDHLVEPSHGVRESMVQKFQETY